MSLRTPQLAAPPRVLDDGSSSARRRTRDGRPVYRTDLHRVIGERIAALPEKSIFNSLLRRGDWPR
jgi:hypothetical protein